LDKSGIETRHSILDARERLSKSDQHSASKTNPPRTCIFYAIVKPPQASRHRQVVANDTNFPHQMAIRIFWGHDAQPQNSFAISILNVNKPASFGSISICDDCDRANNDTSGKHPTRRDTNDDQIVVTASRIAHAKVVDQPVTTLTGATIDAMGYTNIGTALNGFPLSEFPPTAPPVHKAASVQARHSSICSISAHSER
jgi:hypothetical protein